MARVHSRDVRKAALERLRDRGIELKDVADIVYKLQSPYSERVTREASLESVEAVLKKREVQHAILVGTELDKLAEKGLISEPLQTIVSSDEELFGCDETLALGSVLGFGSIAVTTFGFLDKEKMGIIKALDCSEGNVNTFLDDLVAGIAASASSRLAHRVRDEDEGSLQMAADNVPSG